MKTNPRARRFSLAGLSLLMALLTTALVATAPHASAQGAATSRPIAEFLNAQATFCVPSPDAVGCLFIPPWPNVIGWTTPAPALARLAVVDYAGKLNAYIVSQGGRSLATTADGSVTERRLADGRAEVTVLLSTRNALTWVAAGPPPGSPPDFGGAPLLFGARPSDVLAGRPPGLANSQLDVTFTNTAPGAPLPDLIQLALYTSPGQQLNFIRFHAQADGPLHLAFGVPEGTPGRATVAQNALIAPAIRNGFKGGLADAFPVERIDVGVRGR